MNWYEYSLNIRVLNSRQATSDAFTSFDNSHLKRTICSLHQDSSTWSALSNEAAVLLETWAAGSDKVKVRVWYETFICHEFNLQHERNWSVLICCWARTPSSGLIICSVHEVMRSQHLDFPLMIRSANKHSRASCKNHWYEQIHF